MLEFLCQIKILLMNMLELLKNPDFLFKIPVFFLPKLTNSRFFQVKWQPSILRKTYILFESS